MENVARFEDPFIVCLELKLKHCQNLTKLGNIFKSIAQWTSLVSIYCYCFEIHNILLRYAPSSVNNFMSSPNSKISSPRGHVLSNS